MHWFPPAEAALKDLVSQVPEDWRESVQQTARKAAELRARQIGNNFVDVDTVVIGYLQATPAHLRPALRPVLQAAGIDVSRFSRHFW